MADRRSFLGAVSGAAASVLLVKTAEAQSAPSPPPPSPAPRASASAAPKPPSAAARAQAEAMRAFDPTLSEAELDAIARGIDGNFAAGEKLDKRGRALKNADEPATRFAVDAVR